MRWLKKGLIYCPDGSSAWAKHSALTPTPFLLSDKLIRVFVSFRDNLGVGRIGYVDIDAKNPSIVLNVSKDPVLDVGIPGTFDDNGVILGDILEIDGKLFMFYVGFQLVDKVKFLAFTGLAESKDDGHLFKRVMRTPIMDRADEGIYIRAIHSVIVENNKLHIWYAAGCKWQYIDGKPYPCYEIKNIQSGFDMTLGKEGYVCLTPQGDEYRIGRPRVYKYGNRYIMLYTKGTLDRKYLIGYAESKDGKNWIRNDENVGIGPSTGGWDSSMICYGSILRYKENVYMFYNGDDMGKTGFGYAILDEW